MRISRVAIGVFCLCLAAVSQEFRGTMSGTVTDVSGGGVAGATVVATETGNGTKVQTVSDTTGQYTLPFLAPGNYDLSSKSFR